MATYYVSAGTGNDGNPGTIGLPFATIQKGANVSNPGDTIFIRNGTYNPVTITRSGTSGNPITFINYPGEAPIIRDSTTQSDSNTVETLWLSAVSWIVVDGLTIQRGENPILVYPGSSNNIIQNCTVTQGWESGILIYASSNNNTVQNCIITDNNQDNWPRGRATSAGVPWGSALNAAEGSSNNILQDNYVYWNHGEGLNIWSVSTGSPGSGNIARRNQVADNWSVNLYVSGVTNTTVDSNIVWETNAAKTWSVGGIDNNPLGIGLSIEGTGTLTGTVIKNNIVVNCRDGINAFNQNNGKPYTGWLILNNTLVRNDNGLKINNNGNSVTSMTIEDNIILQGSGGFIAQISPTPSANTFKNNLYSGSAGNAFQYGASTTNYAGWVTATSETGSVNSDPLLVAATNIPPRYWSDASLPAPSPLIPFISVGTDYNLASTSSPAYNAGFTTTPDVTVDIINTTRPQGASYDIGAFEFLQPTPPFIALPVSEPFTGTGSLASDWTQMLEFAGATLSRSSNQCKGDIANHDCMAFWGSSIFNAAQYSQCTIVTGLAVGAHYAILLVRASGTGANIQAYGLVTDGVGGSSSDSYFFKIINNSVSVLTGISTPGSNGNRIRLTISKDHVMKFWIDYGDNRGWVETATYAIGSSPQLTSGGAGLGVYDTTTNTMRLDNWEGGNYIGENTLSLLGFGF